MNRNVNRVVVTGAGVISPIGHTADAYCAALKQGQPGIGPITIPYAEELNQKVVAEVKDYDPAKYLDDRQIAMMDRVSQFAVIAAREAIAQAGIDFADGLSERTATIIGIGVGGQTTHDDQFRRLYKQDTPRVHPLTIPKLMANAPASQISMDRGLRGPAFAVASACASATHAIGVAFHMVRSGAVACAVTGGAEACITVGTVKGWEAMRVMAPDTCRPFSKDRKGMVLGEGAAAIVLEPLEAAQARGADHPRRDRRLRHERGRQGTDLAGPGRHGAGDRGRAGGRQARPERHPIRQRPRHRHHRERRRRNQGDPAGVRRACRQARGLLDQVDGRACARRRRARSNSWRR